MGRELRRKQAKKEGKSLKNDEIIETNQIKKLIITLLVVAFFAGLIYLLSALFVTKELDWFTKENENVEKRSTGIILAKEIFNQKEEEYYVYFYDFNEEEKDKDITNTVTSKITSSLYKVDSSSALNSNYVSETTNKKAKKLEDLKVKNHTLIKISAGTIKEYYEDDEITKKLG